MDEIPRLRRYGIRRLQSSQPIRWLKGKIFGARGMILLYHRVGICESDPDYLRVSPENFRAQLEILTTHFHPATLGELVSTTMTDSSARQKIAITFDDGYAENLYNAKPLLERYGIPATFFVTAGYIGNECEFWWDELERILLRTESRPKRLHVKVHGKLHEWNFHDAPEAASRKLRQKIYRWLTWALRYLGERQRRNVLDELAASMGTVQMGPSSHPALSVTELLHLAEGDLAEVGAHSVTHPVLSELPITEQRTEIRQSKVWLEGTLGRPVTSFAYPYGKGPDYTSETVGLVRELGFDRACSAIPDAVRPGANPFQLPRVTVHDWNGDKFLKTLRSWLDGRAS